MQRLAIAMLLSIACGRPLTGQERDPSLRISVALEKPAGIDISTVPQIPDYPIKLGPFRQVAPERRGEVIRLSLPIGEYVANAIGALASAKRRRDEAAARRKVDEALREFAEQQRRKK